MKKIAFGLFILIIMMFLFATDANAAQVEQSTVQTATQGTTTEQSTQDTTKSAYDELLSQSNADSLLNMLPDDTKKSLHNIGADSANALKLSDISFFSILKEILSIAASQMATPLKTVGCVLAIMLLYAVLDCFKDSLNVKATQQVLDIVTTICITCALVIPITQVISSATETIKTASSFMLAYVPIMAVVMIASGHAISGSSYYTTMILAGEGVTQISSNVIAPLLNIFLGISVTSSITPNLNLKGFTSLISKIIKWILAFTMSVFTAVLTFKSIITTSADNVSTRAVRFTLSSFIPIVGSALSEAYKTVQSSVNLLKSGIGVLVIISVAVIFLPIISQCLIWIISVQVSKSVGEILNLNQPCLLLEAVGTVLSTLLAVILCIMSVFIISTAVVLLAGGAGG